MRGDTHRHGVGRARLSYYMPLFWHLENTTYCAISTCCTLGRHRYNIWTLLLT